MLLLGILVYIVVISTVSFSYFQLFYNRNLEFAARNELGNYGALRLAYGALRLAYEIAVIGMLRMCGRPKVNTC